VASINGLTLSMTPGPGNETITVKYNIVWSTFDVTSKLPYIERVILRGDDTRAGEVGPDDVVNVISATTLTPSGNPNVAVPRSHTTTLALADINEDQRAGDTNPNPDEFRALVTLTPRLPVNLEVESINTVIRTI
jgi:hypothetical protein